MYPTSLVKYAAQKVWLNQITLASSYTKKNRTPPVRATVEFIDARDHHKRSMLDKLKSIDWSPVLLSNDVDTITDEFYGVSSKQI